MGHMMHGCSTFCRRARARSCLGVGTSKQSSTKEAPQRAICAMLKLLTRGFHKAYMGSLSRPARLHIRTVDDGSYGEGCDYD